MIAALSRLGGAALRAAPWLERPAFSLLKASHARPFRSARFRLFKAWAAGLPPDRAVRPVTLPGGVRMVADVRDWAGLAFIEPTAIEPATTAYLLANLRPGDVFADVGANVGYMGLQAAARVGPAGAVWCFEPNPRLADLVRESVRVNGFAGRVHVSPVALTDADGPDRPFFLSADPSNSGLSSLAPDAAHRAAGRMDGTAPVPVPVAAFDGFAARNAITRLDAVKIDVEGAEEGVVRGMAGALGRLRPRFVVCETALDSPAARLLQGHGYAARMLEPFGRPDWGNVLFTPAEAARAA